MRAAAPPARGRAAAGDRVSVGRDVRRPKGRGRRPDASGLRRRALRRLGPRARAFRALRARSRRTPADAARLARRAGHGVRALLRNQFAAGGPRDDERDQRRLSHRLLCGADALRGLGAGGRAAAPGRRRGEPRLPFRRRAACAERRAGRAAVDRRRPRSDRRPRLGAQHRVDADVSRPRAEAAGARVHSIRAVRRARRPVGARVRNPSHGEAS